MYVLPITGLLVQRCTNKSPRNHSLYFLRPITRAEAFEAVDWLADLPQQT